MFLCKAPLARPCLLEAPIRHVRKAELGTHACVGQEPNQPWSSKRAMGAALSRRRDNLLRSGLAVYLLENTAGRALLPLRLVGALVVSAALTIRAARLYLRCIPTAYNHSAAEPRPVLPCCIVHGLGAELCASGSRGPPGHLGSAPLP